MVLDTNSFPNWNDCGKYLLHGDGKTMWFDKSFNAVFFNDGKFSEMLGYEPDFFCQAQIFKLTKLTQEEMG